MKISSYHKKNGDDVEWYNGLEYYDKVYMSKVFTFTPDDQRVIQADKVVKGGTGYDISIALPYYIESILDIDYTIYPMFPFSIQFFSRGCIRKCPFCLVRDKEGYIQSVAPMNLNPNGKHIEVLDNNFFANPTWKDSVSWLKKTKLPINLHGVDVRIMDEEQAYHLNRLKIKGSIHIAWDNPKQDITFHLKEMIKYIKPYKITCYVLTGFNSTIEEDIYRVEKLRELGISPFVQPYRDFENNRTPSKELRAFARYVNHKATFKSTTWENYKYK